VFVPLAAALAVTLDVPAATGVPEIVPVCEFSAKPRREPGCQVGDR